MTDRRERRPQRRKLARAAIEPVATKALVIVVGLPQAVLGEVGEWVAAALAKPVRVMPIAASPDDNKPYSRSQTDLVIASAVDYAHRKRRADQQPAPSSILLLYVPGPTQEPVLTAFDFFVFPVPLTGLSQFQDGRQLRHNRDEVRRAIELALTPESAAMQRFEAVHTRVRAVRDAEALQMPPRNFHLARDRPIAGLFQALRRGDQAWEAPIEGLEAQAFDKKRLPRLRHAVTRRAFQDARGLVFLRAALLAHHGPNREIFEDDAPGEPDEEVVEETAAQHLRGAFRFGCPLDSGFHHDVQLEGGRTLETILLECARKGPRRSRHTYVNIYPNDILRGRKMAAP